MKIHQRPLQKETSESPDTTPAASLALRFSTMRPHGWIGLLLVMATLAVFYQVRYHEFVAYDDTVHIIQNTQVRDGLSAAGFVRAFQPYDTNWIPLTWISYQANYALFALEPAGYLLTNVALHAASAVLLYWVLFGMTGAIWRSAFVAAIFALHPLHVESVAWATERKDVLSGLFWMLTLRAYTNYCQKPRTLSRYLLVLLSLALGLMAKPMLVTLPFVLLLLDYWPLGRLQGSKESAWPRASALRAALVEKLPMFGLSAVASAVTFIVQRESGAVHALDRLPLGFRCANALESYAIYVWTTLWPSGLAAFYPHPSISISTWRVGISALFLLATSVLVARNIRSKPYAIVGWLWYLGTLVPVIGLVQVGMQARADRYMYLPLIGLSILATWGVSDFSARWRVPRPALAAMASVILVAFGMSSWQQARTWRNTETLYRRALAVTDENYLAHTGLGNFLLLRGQVEEASGHFTEAVRIAPGWSKARMGLADVAAARGRLSEALRIYQTELQRDPDSVEAMGRYGIALGLAGRYAEARPHMLRALDAHPGIAELHLSLSIIEAKQGNPRESVHYGREALRLLPDSVEAANNLAWLLATCHDSSLREPDEAIRLIENIALESQDPNLLDTLAAAYAAAGRFDAATSTANHAVARAEALDMKASASEFRARISLYRRGKPYIQ